MTDISEPFFALHEKLAREALAKWDRNDPHRPTVEMLVAAGELEDRRKLAAWEAKRAVWAV
jgi:hypothetical protein